MRSTKLGFTSSSMQISLLFIDLSQCESGGKIFKLWLLNNQYLKLSCFLIEIWINLTNL